MNFASLNIEKLSFWEKEQYFSQIDYLIVGAGIVGYSTGLHLRKAYPKAKITIIERGNLPSGASSKNAGFACFGSATELFDDLSNFNSDTVWETVHKRWEGLKYLRELIGDSNLDLQINGSWDLITKNQGERFHNVTKILPDLNNELHKISGEKEVFTIDVDVSSKFGFNGISNSFRNKLEGQIDTGKMNRKFFQLSQESNIDVLFGIEALKIEENNLITSIGIIKANNILVCTNGFANQLIENIDIQPARAQVLITKPIENLKIKGTFHYDCGYYYFRNINNRILFGGGRNLDFKAETTTQLDTSQLISDKLKELLNSTILPNTDFEIDYHWAGIMGVGKTKMPIIQKINSHTYCAIRLGGMGVAIGTLVGKELAELVD